MMNITAERQGYSSSGSQEDEDKEKQKKKRKQHYCEYWYLG